MLCPIGDIRGESEKTMNNNISWEDIIGALQAVGIDAPADILAAEILGISLDKLYEIADVDVYDLEDEEE